MKQLMKHLALSFLVSFAVTLPAEAAVPANPKLSPTLALRLQLESRGLKPIPQRRAVVVRFGGAPSAAQLAALEGPAVQFSHRSGRAAVVGRYVGARVTDAGLAKLRESDAVERVLPAMPRMTAPLPPESEWGYVHELTRAEKLWGLRDDQGRRITGQGIVMADIDDGIDVFHPLFFHADGGYHAWFDLDHDGALTPGVDAVDHNDNGALDRGEILQVLDYGIWDRREGGWAGIDDGEFVIGYDWLYADLNGNGQRDFGPEAGFGDDAPSFGEPLYVVDDVDGDGQLGPDEKLIALGTSKLRAVFDVVAGEAFVRGENLTEFVNAEGQGSHGTGVAGVLLGGVLDRTLIQGVAPDAELVMLSRGGWGGDGREYDPVADLVTGIEFARSHGASIILHEYGTLVGEACDGGSEWEGLLDDLTAEGLPQLTATHNFAGMGGHAEGALETEEVRDVELVIEDPYVNPYPVSLLYMTVRWRGEPEALRATLVSPNGAEFLMAPGSGGNSTFYVANTAATTPRGTNTITTYVGRLALGGMSWIPFESEIWTIRLENMGAEAQPFDVSLSTDTGYAMGLRWGAGVTITDHGTIAHPSTADTAISVGACTGNEVIEDVGEVEDGIKYYSGRGPRIDGERGVDVVAPEDHYSALQGGHYMKFGGTSGATPQVTAAIALLLQQSPDLTPAEIKTLVHERASADDLTGEVPNVVWGYGRLNTFRLVTGEDPPEDNQPPVAAVTLPDHLWVNEPHALDASASSDPDGDALTYRWDFDYDGTWDFDAATGRSVESPETGHVLIGKLEVEDIHGATDQLLVIAEFEERPPEPGPDVVAPTTDVVPSEEDAAAHGDATGVHGDAVVAADVDSEDGDSGGGGGGGGCAPTNRPAPTLWLAALALLTIVVRRRRRSLLG